MSDLQEKIRDAPTGPGCYLYRDIHDYIIYVGKAKNLRKRVKSYFTKAAAQDERTAELVPKIVDVEYQTTASELDALMLEHHLIKTHKPWFNSAMKADKRRPYLRISTSGHYPSLSIVAERPEDDAHYFDCFTDEEEIKAALALMCRVWQVPCCGAAAFVKPGSPCIYHSIAGCMAPCTGRANADACHAAVGEILRFMGGKRIPRLAAMKREMQAHAAALEFEAAGQQKALLAQLEQLQRKAKKVFHFPQNGDILVLIRPFREQAFSAFYVHDGVAHSRVDFPAGPDAAVVERFIVGWAAGTPALAPWVAACLLDIAADKAFVPLKGGSPAAAVQRAVERFYRQSKG